MSITDPGITDALTPVREALMAAASAQAERLRAEAAVTSETALAAAREQAAAILAQARRQGAADAAVVQAAAQARTRRQARAELLLARREAYEHLRARARAAVSGLQSDGGYADLRTGLGQAVTRALGGNAEVRDAEGGGVIGESAGRRLDLSLIAFADRAVEELAGELFAAEASPDEPRLGGAR